MKTFYLQNQSGLFLTCDKDGRKLSVEEQDFSVNQTWFHSGKDGKLFCGNGTCLKTQWGMINVESNSADDNYENLLFYFQDLGDCKYHIGQLEDRDKKFEGDEKQRFLAVIGGGSYFGTIDSALENADEASIADFIWEKVSPEQSTYAWVSVPKKDIPNGAFIGGEEKGQKIFPAVGFSPDGYIHSGKIWSPDGARWMACHDENKMMRGAFYLQSESGLYLTSGDFNALTLEKLIDSPSQIWYWDESYNFQKKCPGPDRNELRCAAGNCLYMQGEDDPETIVYASESTSEDNRHKFYSREMEDGNFMIGKFTEKDGEKETGAFVGFHSQGYFKTGTPSKDADMQFKWKKIPVNQAYKWTTMDTDHDVPENALSIDIYFKDDKPAELFMGRAEVNGVIYPGNISDGIRNFGYVEQRSYGGMQQKNNEISTVRDEKFSVLCADPAVPDIEFIWVEMPDLKHPSRAYQCDYSKFPTNAVIGGIIGGAVYYVGRGSIENRVVTGIFKPKHDKTKLEALHEGKMHQLEKFEVLVMRKKNGGNLKSIFDRSEQAKNYYFGVDNAEREVVGGIIGGIDIRVLCVHPNAEVDWVDYEDGKLPNNAVIAGLSGDGVTPTGIFYVGRGVFNKETIPGIFLHKKSSRQEKSQAIENTLYSLYNGDLHKLKKFQVLVVKRHYTGGDGEKSTLSPEKSTTPSKGNKEGDWKLIVTGNLPAGYESVQIDQQNFSEHAEKIRSLTLKAIEEGTIKFAKKKDGNTKTDDKPKNEASLGDLVGALGGLMTAFAPPEEAQQIQQQVDMMAGLLTAIKLEPSAPEEGKGKQKDFSASAENASGKFSDSSVVVLVGGFIPHRGSSVASTLSDSIEVFDPQRLCDLNYVKLPEKRHASSVHYLKKTGQILICGGEVQGCVGDETDSVTKSCYVLAEGSIKPHSNMLGPKRLHLGAVCSDKLWIFGGQSGDIRDEGVKVSDGDSYSSIESMSIPGNVWSKEAIQLEEARSDGCAVTIDDENILLIGGVNNCGKDLVMKTQVTKFNTKSLTFTTLAPMLDDEEGITFCSREGMKGGRQGHSSVFIPARNGGSGHVLVAGGEGKGYVLETSQIYDIDANEWSWAGKLNTGRKHGAMVYVDGRIFFMGGSGGFEKLDSIEEYNPEKKTWTVLDWTLKTPNMWFSATVVPRSIIGKLQKPETLKFESKGDAVHHRENRMGTYSKTYQIIEGCPVFEQELSPPGEKHYLFVGPNGCWRVGPDVTSYSGSVLKNPKKHKKIPPKSGWLYYLNDEWVKDETLELTEYKEVEVSNDDEDKKWEEEKKERAKKEKEAVETAFAKADTEGTGKLTKDQLKTCLGELIEAGHDAAFISNKKMLENDDSMKMFIEVADRDGDKLINLIELLIIMDLGDEKLDHKEMFTKLVKAADKDGNGLITTEELRSMIVTAGFEEEDDASEMANMFMSMGDLRGDKKLKIEEVVNLFTDGPPEEDSKEKMKRMFKLYDTDEDGYISKKELIEYIKTMGYVDEDDTPEDVNMMMNMLMAGADKDNDGKLNYEEFCKFLDD